MSPVKARAHVDLALAYALDARLLVPAIFATVAAEHLVAGEPVEDSEIAWLLDQVYGPGVVRGVAP